MMFQEAKPLISVIIPVYNVEPYLDKCMDSVVNQTYRNLEIILVDDGSTDGSGKKCDDYAKIDKRISVIHKENSGLSDARNTALDIMHGELVTFIDSDDYVDRDIIEVLYELRQQYKADISCVSIKRVFENKKSNVKYSNNIKIYSGITAIERMLYKKDVDTSAYAKLYLKNDFKNVRYPKNMIFEDWATTYKIFFKKQRVVCCGAQKYFYLQRPGSIIHQRFSYKRFDRIIIARQILEWTRDECPELTDAAKARFFSANVQTLREIPLNDEWKDDIEKIRTCIVKYRKDVIKNRNVKFMDRIIAISTYLNIKNLKRLGKLYKFLWP